MSLHSQTQEYLKCVKCEKTYDINDIKWRCDCGDLLAVERPLEYFKKFKKDIFDKRLLSSEILDQSGVWRFRELVRLIDSESIIAHPEGNTRIYQHGSLNDYAGVKKLYFKHEGENPTGSFKDRGMTVAVSQAKHLGCKILACASTGNTSSSLAAYAAQAGLTSVVFLPANYVSKGKLSQALGYGAHCLAIEGDFDHAMKLVEKAAANRLVYLVNSLNPFRLEGQKTIIWEMLQQLAWASPDWIVVPGGNLGNTSAFGKALLEAYHAGWIDKIPRIACIQADGASPFYKSFKEGFTKLEPVKANTIATAIRIGNPVNFSKAHRVIKNGSGLVLEVSDDEIWEAKQKIDHCGIGCEPASAVTLAGIRTLVHRQMINKDDHVVAVLTGHILKDGDILTQRCGARYHQTAADYDKILSIINNLS